MQNASAMIFATAYAYAQRNGYKGTYDDYLVMQHAQYVQTCDRCEIEPMDYLQWFDAKREAAREQAIVTQAAVYFGHDEDGMACYALPFSLN